MCKHSGFASTKQPVPIPMSCMYWKGASDMCSLPMDFCRRSRIIDQEFLVFIPVWCCGLAECYGGDNENLSSCKKYLLHPVTWCFPGPVWGLLRIQSTPCSITVLQGLKGAEPSVLQLWAFPSLFLYLHKWHRCCVHHPTGCGKLR